MTPVSIFSLVLRGLTGFFWFVFGWVFFFRSLKNQDATSSFSEGIFEMAAAGIQKSQLSGQPSEMQG